MKKYGNSSPPRGGRITPPTAQGVAQLFLSVFPKVALLFPSGVAHFFLSGWLTFFLTFADKQMKELSLTPHSVQPKQNYTLVPQPVELERQYEVSCQRTVNSYGESLSEQYREVIFA